MVWNELAVKYDRLWVQKYSLTPTRSKILCLMKYYLEAIKKDNTTKDNTTKDNTTKDRKNKDTDNFYSYKLLDIGCGTGQLLLDIQETYPHMIMTGIDKSVDMLDQAKGKNINAQFFQMDITQPILEELKFETYDFIVCSHSFPYYPEKELVIEKVKERLSDEGIAIFVQASINSMYDKIAMYVIEKTAEKAEYLSRLEFVTLVENDFDVLETFTLKERWYMPSICGFVLRKKS